jgi:hypothetical protein
LKHPLPRIFISYRTSDGVDKATALARELNAVFGAALVFLDKEDLPAGVPWREAVGATLGDKPVLLLLVTPQAFDARIEQPDDPVRREITSALDAGAHVIPLLADGVDQLPDALPAPLGSLRERTWRRLRAYDWADDIERLVDDLKLLGIAPPARVHVKRDAERRRWFEIGLALGVGALAGSGLSAWWHGRQADASASAGISGAWSLDAVATEAAQMRLEKITLHLAQTGEEVKLHSEPIDITGDAAWVPFATQWNERFGAKLERVVWRGAGRVRMETGLPTAIDIGLRVETPEGSAPIETGNLSAQAQPDGRRMEGRVWFNGEQAERAARLSRLA